MQAEKFGFAEQRVTRLEELDATLHELEHKKTGARLAWLERAEENKTFGIAFTTLPFDDTGVFHILEHSVLCGSDKYPVKEPFVELLKHSMNTFLNAFTFPDKTVYPLCSRNDKDFLNLIRVYLDAVLHPSIYHRPEIFRQEGWHYEFDADGKPSYKGVVFNEMKGAFADADELTQSAIDRALFPDTPYRYVSGGDPAAIPDLTYEKFIESHRRFYSPSNSRIFLDGAVDIDAVLQILDGEYLCDFDRTERIAPPPMQAPVDGGTQTICYEVASEAEEKGRTRLAWSSVIGTFADREDIVAAQVLADVLCGSNQAPLCRAVLSRGLAENVLLQVMDGVSQPRICLEARNLDTANAAQVEKLLFDELERLADEGIDRGKLEASMANLEFQMRERDYGSFPQGLMYCFQALESWLYGGHPEANLQVGDLFDRLRGKMQDGYFEQLLRRLLLQNPHRCKVMLVPSHTAGEARRQLEADRLARESAAWSDADRAALMQQQEQLIAWQKADDTPEQLATLPCLRLSDIAEMPEKLPLETAQIAGLPVLLHRVNANGIAYFTLYFDADGLSGEELSRLAFLCQLLGHMPTRSHSIEQLNDRTRLLCGDMNFYLSSYTPKGDVNACRTRLCAAFSALQANAAAALDLAVEILTSTLLDDESAALDLLRQNRMAAMEQCIMSGNAVGLLRLSAQFSASGVASEYTGGFTYYQWMKQQEQGWNWQQLQPDLESLLLRVVNKNGLTLSVTGDVDALAQPAAVRLAEALPDTPAQNAPTALKPWGVRREGIAIPADIAFACWGGNRNATGMGGDGAWRLAGKIVGLAYLWNVIRVQGGAYGTGLTLRDNGLAACYSYRDPSAARSLQSYAGCAAFLRKMAADGTDLTGFIIGAVSDSEPLLSPRAKGATADALYWQQTTYADRCRRRQQLLAADGAALNALADALDQTLHNGGVCVVGGRKQLDACHLDEILSV